MPFAIIATNLPICTMQGNAVQYWAVQGDASGVARYGSVWLGVDRCGLVN